MDTEPTNVHPKGRLCGVYCIFNTETGKYYVGKSLDITQRWRRHIKHLNEGKHHSVKLQRSWNKHGSKAFQFEILLLCDKSVLLTEEERLISTFDSYHNGYNGTLRGRDSTGTKRSKEFCEAVALRKTGTRHSEETRQRMSLAQTGREVTQETREKRRVNQTGKQFHLGKLHTEESKEKMRQARILYWKNKREVQSA